MNTKTDNIDPNDSISLRSAANYLDASPTTLRQAVKKGKLKGGKPGKKWMFLFRDLWDYLYASVDTYQPHESAKGYDECSTGAVKHGGSTSTRTKEEYDDLLELE